MNHISYGVGNQTVLWKRERLCDTDHCWRRQYLSSCHGAAGEGRPRTCATNNDKTVFINLNWARHLPFLHRKLYHWQSVLT